MVNPAGLRDEHRLRAAVEGRTVLVTGASFGIGEATARALAKAGATVLLVARSKERLTDLAAEISAHPYPADLTDSAAVEALADEILATHGHVDIVVNNAGKSIRRSIHLSYDRFHDFERTIGVNYLGPVRLLLALLPSMRERGGHIVNVSTVGVRVAPGPRWAAYQASKSAFDVWLRSVSPEIRADGISTTSIYMALVHTRMSAPTAIFAKLPGLRPDQAACLISRAVVDRPRVIAPWWLGPAELISLTARGPIDTAMGLIRR